MLKSEHLVYLCGIFSVVLLSVTVVTLTGKFIFKMDTSNRGVTRGNHVYDPDYGRNVTQICLLSVDPYGTPYEKSPCWNKSLDYWFQPWKREALWRKLWRKGEERRHLEKVRESVVAEETATVEAVTAANQTTEKTKYGEAEDVDGGKKGEKSQGDVLRQKPSEVLYTVLVALVMVSAVGACWEAFRSKFKKEEGSGGGVGGSKGSGKDCSLAEFTINRHLRRESQQQQQHHYHGSSHLPRQASFDIPAKVTQSLIHQSSLDRALPKSVSEVMAREGRRNSMPVSPMGLQSAAGKGSTSFQPGVRSFQRQGSLDVAPEENLSDVRKKSRYFLRRH